MDVITKIETLNNDRVRLYFAQSPSFETSLTKFLNLNLSEGMLVDVQQLKGQLEFFFKNLYKNEIKAGDDRMNSVVKTINSFNLQPIKVKTSGFLADTTEVVYQHSKASERNSADLAIQCFDRDILKIEVTGSYKVNNPRDMWIREGKIKKAQEEAKNGMNTLVAMVYRNNTFLHYIDPNRSYNFNRGANQMLKADIRKENCFGYQELKKYFSDWVNYIGYSA